MDLDVPQEKSDPRFSTEYLFGKARGKMLGVLVCRQTDGSKVALKAFSGQYNGAWQIEGWVPPLFDSAQWLRVNKGPEREIKGLGMEIAAVGANTPRGKELLLIRKRRSAILMKTLHGLYTLHNFCSQRRSLLEAWSGDNGIPNGTADCCGPKLLNTAAKNNLLPLGMAEFFYGRPNKQDTRRHGRFYSPCQEKCRPILGFLLCGLDKSDLPQPIASKPPKSPLTVLYQDDELVVVDKPSGLLSVPGRGPENQDCVVSRAKNLFPGMIEQPAAHRLDMYTSGLMLLARTRDAHRDLSRQFQQHRVEKRYIALVEGIIEKAEGKIHLAFRLDPDNRPYQVYDPVHGKVGITRWKRLNVEGGATRIQFEPLTGRTHQLRLHAAHPEGLGAPVVGDRLYGSGKEDDPMCLHAWQLKFRHPKDGKPIMFEAQAPF